MCFFLISHAIGVYQFNYYLKEVTFGIVDFSLLSDSLIMFFYFFLPFSLGLICTYFLGFLIWALGSLNFNFSSFLIYMHFRAMKCPLITALAAFHNFFKSCISIFTQLNDLLISIVFSLPMDYLEVCREFDRYLSVTKLFNLTVVREHLFAESVLRNTLRLALRPTRLPLW